MDTEHASSISTRKLVLETAKYNVITAYSCEEAAELLQRFPKVNAVVINGTHDHCAPTLLSSMCDLPGVKLVVVGEGPLTGGERAPDILVESFAPSRLLDALQLLFPREAGQLLAHEDELERKQI